MFYIASMWYEFGTGNNTDVLFVQYVRPQLMKRYMTRFADFCDADQKKYVYTTIDIFPQRL